MSTQQYRADGHSIMHDGKRIAVADTPEVAAFLARAANAYEPMRDALQEAPDPRHSKLLAEYGEWYATTRRAALAKAEEDVEANQ